MERKKKKKIGSVRIPSAPKAVATRKGTKATSTKVPKIKSVKVPKAASLEKISSQVGKKFKSAAPSAGIAGLKRKKDKKGIEGL